MAQDKGATPFSRKVEVQIDVVDRANNPPVWDHPSYGPIFCKENVAIGARVVSIKARSVTLLTPRAAARNKTITRPARKSRRSILFLCTFIDIVYRLFYTTQLLSHHTLFFLTQTLIPHSKYQILSFFAKFPFFHFFIQYKNVLNFVSFQICKHFLLHFSNFFHD